MKHFESNMLFKAGKAKSLCECVTYTELWIELFTPEYEALTDGELLMSSATFYKEVFSEEDYESTFEEVGKLIFFQAHCDLTSTDLYHLFDPESNDLSVAATLFNSNLDEDNIYLHNLIIKENFRGQGIGSEIISWLVSYKDNTDLVFFQTVLKKEEKLKSFYKKAFKKFSLKKENQNMLVFERN